MSRVTWGIIGDRRYETGVDQGIFYPTDGPGVPWNGLVSVRSSENADRPDQYYLDGVNYLNVPKSGDFSGTIEAFTYPEEFSAYDGWSESINGLFLDNQKPKSFGLSYRTIVGNAVDGQDHGYNLHIIYNVLVLPSDSEHTTISESPTPSLFRWDFVTKPISVGGRKPLAHVTIDSTKTHVELMAIIEDILYGSLLSEPRLPSLQEVVDLFANFFTDNELFVEDLGDGQYTAQGETVLDSEPTFTVAVPPAIDNGDGTFTLPQGV